MTFNFGSNTGFPSTNTTQTGFGLGAGAAQANKPTFGSPSFAFGSGATTSTASGFGFGNLQSSAPTNTGFGNLQSSAPTNTGFGNLQSSAPTVSGFGNLQSSAPTVSGFGNLQSSAPTVSGFGNLQSSAPTNTGFGGLQSSAPTVTGFGNLQSSAPTGTGFSGFGSGFGASTSTATTTTLTTGTTFGTGTGFSGFGAAPISSTQSTGFGFGSTFGQAGTSGGSLFSGFNQPASVSTGFGGLGSSFGAKPAQTATTGVFGGFGSSLGGSTFGQGLSLQPQQQQQQQVPQNPNEAIYNSIFNCTVYGDERDTTLARWNLLQALWGAGKAYYSPAAPPVDVTPHNPFCRFKAIGYSRMPAAENQEGLVALVFNKTETDIKSQQQQLVASLNSVLGNKPNLSLAVESIKPLSDTKAQVQICVQEKGVTGVRKIPAAELAAYMLQPMPKQQLTSMGVENVFAQVRPDKETLKAYMDTPPAGIDARLWKQAQLDNPDDSRYVPVPMVGFGEVRWRIRCQEHETRLHQAFLDRLSDDISSLKAQQARTTAKAAEHKRKFVELEHRILKVLVRQEVSRKMGMSLQPDEEVLRSQLETLEAQLNAPTQYKGRLGEMLSQMRMQRQEASHQEAERYSMDPAAQEEIRQFLLLEQNGMSHLVDIIQCDLASLSIVKEGMTKMLQGQ